MTGLAVRPDAIAAKGAGERRVRTLIAEPHHFVEPGGRPQVRVIRDALVGRTPGRPPRPAPCSSAGTTLRAGCANIGRTTTLPQAAGRTLAPLLTTTAARHPWTGWTFSAGWGTRETLHVTLVAPELVVEVGVDVARDRGGRWRHAARWHRAGPTSPGRGAFVRAVRCSRPPPARGGDGRCFVGSGRGPVSCNSSPAPVTRHADGMSDRNRRPSPPMRAALYAAVAGGMVAAAIPVVGIHMAQMSSFGKASIAAALLALIAVALAGVASWAGRDDGSESSWADQSLKPYLALLIVLFATTWGVRHLLGKVDVLGLGPADAPAVVAAVTGISALVAAAVAAARDSSGPGARGPRTREGQARRPPGEAEVIRAKAEGDAARIRAEAELLRAKAEMKRAEMGLPPLPAPQILPRTSRWRCRPAPPTATPRPRTVAVHPSARRSRARRSVGSFSEGARRLPQGPRGVVRPAGGAWPAGAVPAAAGLALRDDLPPGVPQARATLPVLRVRDQSRIAEGLRCAPRCAVQDAVVVGGAGRRLVVAVPGGDECLRVDLPHGDDVQAAHRRCSQPAYACSVRQTPGRVPRLGAVASV